MLAEAHNLWVHDKHSMPLGMVSYYCCKAVEFIYSIFVLFQMCDKVFLTSSCEGSVPSCHSVEGGIIIPVLREDPSSRGRVISF
jgi:hypothetical protein